MQTLDPTASKAIPSVVHRTFMLFREHQRTIFKSTDRMFAVLMVIQWLAAIVVALVVSPRAWAGTGSQVHIHVWAAIFLGGAITSLPLLVALLRPGRALTRHTIGVGQMLMGALLIHLTGGRIETHFHVFGSLAFLAFYRDWRVLVSASAVVAVDHLLRGIYWPQSVFGVLVASQWRWLEHAGWVAFEDIFLIISVRRSLAGMQVMARRQAELESVNTRIEATVLERTTELRSSEERFRSLVESASDAIVSADERGNILGWNNGAQKIFGYSEAEVRGQPLTVLMPESFHKAHRRGLARFQATGEARVIGKTVELTGRDKDGKEFPIELSLSTWRSGNQQFYSGIIRDITRRKQIETDLAKARDAALEATRLKAEFLANMSHEIRTPMNGVIGMTGLLLDTPLNDEQRSFAETIRTSADSLLTILNDILDFSKIESGKLTFDCVDFNLREVVEDTMEMLAERAQAKGIELTGAVPPEVPTRLRGDPGRLRQILTNLVSNAIKFTGRGEVVVLVSQTGESENQAVLRFEVRDTGIGIAPEAQSRLFQPFSQADGSTTRKYGGTGLGLAISRQLVALMHGEIGVQSALGEGSIFWFTAPFEKQPGAARTAHEVSADLSDLRVLVVDDNATNRRILHHQILAWRMRNGSVESGRQALATLREQVAAGDPYDVAILDMQMPEMDGRMLAQAIKADPAIAGTRLIILTSLGQMLSPEELKAAGIDAYLVKPVKQSRLFNCLVKVMNQAAAEAGRMAKSATTRAKSTPPPHGAKARVLLAEDNTINQTVALGQLRRLGYNADVVANGQDALAALQRIAYDVVLMDCQMPELDGYETTRRIREQERAGARRHLHIIAMTANALQGDREKCLAAGMDDYISKPVHPDELQAALERWNPAGSHPATPPTAANSPGRHTPSHPTSTQVSPVDLERLKEFGPIQSPETRELVRLYLAQAEAILKELDTAVLQGAAPQVESLAHRLSGASSACGIRAIAELGRELEQRGSENRLAGADQLCAELRRQLERVKTFLQDLSKAGELSTPPTTR